MQGVVLAIGNVQIMNKHEGWLQAVRVDKNWKGKGLGKAMTSALVDKCKQEGVTQILSSTSGDNLPMQKIFARLGVSLLSFENMSCE